MADFLGGAGGLFGGLSQGLQLILALRRAEEDQRIRRGQLDVDVRRENREQSAQDVAQERAPYADIQTQLNKRNVTADLGSVRREYAPPSTVDTYQNTNQLAPPTFGALQQSGPPKPVQDLNTSHIAQVLERAKRHTGYDLHRSALDSALNTAEKQAQQTQLPVSEGLPQGFEAQPDRTFTPYQLSGRPDPLDNIFGPLLNKPIDAEILRTTDPVTYKQFEEWKARRIGGGGGQNAQQIIDAVLQEHPSWTDQQVADEVRRRMRTP